MSFQVDVNTSSLLKKSSEYESVSVDVTIYHLYNKKDRNQKNYSFCYGLVDAINKNGDKNTSAREFASLVAIN